MKLAGKTAVTKTKPKRRARKQDGEIWTLRLYIAGQTPNSIMAVTNLKRICEERLQGRYRIEVIDLLLNPQLAKGDQIVAIPTVVRKTSCAGEENCRQFIEKPRCRGGIRSAIGDGALVMDPR